MQTILEIGSLHYYMAMIWFVLWGVLWAIYFMLDGFDLGGRNPAPLSGQKRS